MTTRKNNKKLHRDNSKQEEGDKQSYIPKTLAEINQHWLKLHDKLNEGGVDYKTADKIAGTIRGMASYYLMKDRQCRTMLEAIRLNMPISRHAGKNGEGDAPHSPETKMPRSLFNDIIALLASAVSPMLDREVPLRDILVAAAKTEDTPGKKQK
jgi:hypothetical protein